MPRYTVKDEETGRKITFDWNGDGEPTDEDMAEIFSAAGPTQQKVEPTPKQATRFDSSPGFVGSMTGDFPPYSLGESLKNIPSNAYQYLKGMASSVIHPLETAKTLGSLSAGGAQAAMAGLTGNEKLNPEGLAKARFDALVNDYKKTYGSLKGFTETLEKEPLRVPSDLSMMLLTGGSALRNAGKLSKSEELLNIGSKLSKAGSKIEPFSMAMEAASLPAKAVPSRWLQKMYASSAKMKTVMDVGMRQRLSQKLLDANVVPTPKGFMKLANDFEKMWRSVDDLIDNYVTTGANEKRTVNDILKGLDAWEERAKLTGRSSVVKNIRKQFERDLTEKTGLLDSHGNEVITLKQLDAKEINRVKRDLYKELHSQYGREMAPLKSEVKMAIAHNAMEIIEELIPGVVPKNKTAAAYKEMMDAIKNGVNRIENRDLFSIGIPIRAGGVAVLGDMAGVDQRISGVLGAALGILDVPTVKARLAVRINKLKQAGVKIRPSMAALRLGFVKVNESGEFVAPRISYKEIPIKKVGKLTDRDLLNPNRLSPGGR